jgi:polysaccharide export outer membrane protein
MKYLTFALALLCAVRPVSGQGEYMIGAQDVLTITVYDQADLGGKYTVELDGTINFPLVGRIKAAGLSIRQFETELRKLLADGFFKNPQVTVGVEQYRSQRIFIVGEVRSPGIHPLTGGMTLIEALARAGATGSGTESAPGEVVIVRGRDNSGPVLPGQDQSAEVIRVNLKELERGNMALNHAMRDGDTIFVPKAEEVFVYVTGQVRNPGAYPIRKDTTVLQAIALAGGITENGAMGRVRIIRMIDGKEKEIRVKPNDVVQPGDTIKVPERFF